MYDSHLGDLKLRLIFAKNSLDLSPAGNMPIFHIIMLLAIYAIIELYTNLKRTWDSASIITNLYVCCISSSYMTFGNI